MSRIQIKDTADKTDTWRGSWKRWDRYGSHARTIAQLKAGYERLPVLDDALVDTFMLLTDLKETLRRLGIE